MPACTSVNHRQRSDIHNRPVAACLHWKPVSTVKWYSPAFGHMVRLAGTEDASEVWRVHIQCSCSEGLEQLSTACPCCWEHWHF